MTYAVSLMSVLTYRTATDDLALEKRSVGWTGFAQAWCGSSLGLVVLSLAYALGRSGHSSGQMLYWSGQILLIAPLAWRVLRFRVMGSVEAALLVAVLAVNQYLAKWMYSPLEMKFPDEMQHLRGTTNVIDAGQLFQPNLSLPISTHYPALESLGAAIAQLTGLSVTASGFLVAAFAHLIFMGGLFILAWRVTGAPWIGALATLIYASNPHFAFFDSMYIYQTPALAFLVLVLWSARRWRGPVVDRSGFLVLGVVSILVATISHHVTSFMVVGALGLVAICDITARRGRRTYGSTVFALVAFVAVLTWTLTVARDTVSYLGTPIKELLTSLVSVLHGQLFADSPGSAPLITPLSDRIIGLAGLLILIYALVRGTTWLLRKADYDPWNRAVILGLPVLIGFTGLRFVAKNGAELTGRAATFYYILVALLAALGIARGLASGPTLRKTTAWTGAIALLYLAGLASGVPAHWGRIPGPFLVSAFERSVDAPVLRASDWALANLGSGNRWSGDRNMTTTLGTLGGQDPVHPGAALFYESVPSLASRQLVQANAVAYLAVDRRISRSLPLSGSYFDNDPLSNRLTEPIATYNLEKFDAVPEISRIYDSGDIRLYDLSRSWYVWK